MTSSQRNTVLSGLVFMARRERLTPEQRVKTPPNEFEATVMARDTEVELDIRILCLHRLMDIAIADTSDKGKDRWRQIFAIIQDDFDCPEIPMMVYRRFAESVHVDFPGTSDWAKHQVRQATYALDKVVGPDQQPSSQAA